MEVGFFLLRLIGVFTSDALTVRNNDYVNDKKLRVSVVCVWTPKYIHRCIISFSYKSTGPSRYVQRPHNFNLMYICVVSLAHEAK